MVYDLAARALVPLVTPMLALHPRLRGDLAQRFGRWRLQGPIDHPIWLHGSSAGDVAALVPLARRLGAQGFPLVLSAWTRSGHQMARQRLESSVQVFRAPLDLAPTVRRVLDRLQPRLLVLECLELWPSLVAACARRGIPVAVVNGRLSVRSLRNYRRVDRLFRPCFASLSLVTALTPEDAGRFAEAGVDPRWIVVASSSKHDRLDDPPARPTVDRGRARGCKLVLGSIHREEESMLLDWLPRLLQRFSDLELVVAPRYPHRAGAVRRRLQRLGAPCRPSPGARVTVVDTIGTLADQYREATVAFVGGSLVAKGGHNLVEPASAGAAVLTGPHTEHCRGEARMLVQAGGAKVVGPGSVQRETEALLQSPREAGRMGQRARRVAGELAGACEKIAGHLTVLARREADL